MSLKGPNSGIRWKDYQITTPTFHLSSIEKPDFSPFLIHMTGRNQLLNILRGENAPEDVQIPENNGFLKSSIPSFNGNEGYYNSGVVCFTESPLFSLDFFRYRSYSRWQADQQFGIGFSKTDLVNRRNVRPVIYLETETNTEILSLCNQILNDNLTVSDNNGEVKDLKPLMEKIKPLLFPLLQDKPSQGFMWEREWRCPNEIGMSFPLSAIKVICCPNNERAEISELLADYIDNIQIVESWREYDDVTSFLKRRKSQVQYDTADKIQKVSSVNALRELKQQNDQTLHTLSAYYGVFKETVNQLERKSVSDTLKDLENTSKIISERMKKVEAEIKAKEEQAKMKK
jgi:hypothetical protein